jgi:hypothetical protein
MHNFLELIDRCIAFNLGALKKVEKKTITSLQMTGATSLVKTLQMIRVQKTILAVGIFSLFEAILQDRLNCTKGFAEAKSILEQKGELALLPRFTDLELAINALKHGQGRSYNALVAKNGGRLDSHLKDPDERFFNEGDVSEITTLIDVDEKFIYTCLEVISQVSEAIKQIRPEFIL